MGLAYDVVVTFIAVLRTFDLGPDFSLERLALASTAALCSGLGLGLGLVLGLKSLASFNVTGCGSGKFTTGMRKMRTTFVASLKRIN